MNPQEVLVFCVEPKQRKEIEEEFKLSNTQSYNLLTWMDKCGMLMVKNFPVVGRGGLMWTYQAKKRYLKK